VLRMVDQRSGHRLRRAVVVHADERERANLVNRETGDSGASVFDDGDRFAGAGIVEMPRSPTWPPVSA